MNTEFIKSIFALIGNITALIVVVGLGFGYFLYQWDEQTKSNMKDADKKGFGRKFDEDNENR